VNLLHPFHLLRLEIARNRLGLLFNSNFLHERFHPKGWEPEVLQCLCERKWNGPVWDVGASLGRHAYRVARYHPVFAFEPNLNSLQFLAYNLRHSQNVVIVPCALTVDGQPMVGSFHPDFLAPPTGPKVATLSISEALQKFGKPGLIKIDIEGGEYEMIKHPELRGIPLLIEWHREIPTQLEPWTIETIDPSHSLLMPKTA
jgi:FkbM family methyltransferase